MRANILVQFATGNFENRTSHMRKLIPILIAAAVAAACAPAPPAPPAPVSTVPVNASFGRTWDALIDEFAQQNIPIKTIDRTSGLIATDPLGVAPDATDASDCGKDWLGTHVLATNGVYNALVRGDSSHSTVRVTVRWTRTGPSRVMGQTSTVVTEECSTKGTWETALEQKIKSRAEGGK